MKNTLKLSHSKCEIVMDATFARNAENTMSPEYAHLQQVRKDYPNYTVITRTIKRNSSKKTYNGLTYEWMEDYILTHGTAEESEKILNEFNEMRLIAECHSKAFRYPTIKAWFLDRFSEIKAFGVKEDDAATNDAIPAPITELPRIA